MSLGRSVPTYFLSISAPMSGNLHEVVWVYSVVEMRLGMLTRWSFSALLALSVSLCCCQGQQVLGLMWGGALSHSSTNEHDPAAPHGSSEQVAHGSQDAYSQQCEDGSCEDGPCNGDTDCSCGHTDLLAVLPSGVAMDVNLIPSLTFFTFSEVAQPIPLLRMANSVRVESVFYDSRPPTSLLRLHCALQV